MTRISVSQQSYHHRHHLSHCEPKHTYLKAARGASMPMSRDAQNRIPMLRITLLP